MTESTGLDDFNEKVIREFRDNNGKVGGWFEGRTVLLLHHKGARTGTQRVNPLMYQKVADSYAIFASNGGDPADPKWYHNLLTSPDTVIEVDNEKIGVRARVAGPDERGPIWEKQMRDMPNFAEYEKTAAPREIPVIILDPVS
ncbi:MAG TPA: nitroreductase/quinone reductase family protein [Streptosporangiaceae bacterium]|nr:nitroreductase/quinone reductase family protein [Streptosporangiaceae bacterium]